MALAFGANTGPRLVNSSWKFVCCQILVMTDWILVHKLGPYDDQDLRSPRPPLFPDGILLLSYDPMKVAEASVMEVENRKL